MWYGTNVVQGYSFIGDNTPETLFLHYVHILKSLFCEDISVEYEFRSEKFKGVSIDLIK